MLYSKWIVGGWLLGFCAMNFGCNPSTTVERQDDKPRVQVAASYQEEANNIQDDPEAYLRQMYTRCDALTQYRCRFFREERLGPIIPKLTTQEEMSVAFRKSPFSVKFDWVEPERYDGLYFESVYVEGENGDKVIVRERRGAFLLPAQVRQVSLETPVKLERSKRPVTDFGVAGMLRRSLEPIDDPEIHDDIVFEYKGVIELDTIQRPAHHLVVHRPVKGKWIHKQQDIYIDAETLLPAGVDVWLESGELDGRYRFADIDTTVVFDETTFKLREGHPEPKD